MLSSVMISRPSAASLKSCLTDWSLDLPAIAPGRVAATRSKHHLSA